MEFEFEEDKFRELLLYIGTKCEDDIYFGATRLNKQLFYGDFLAFMRLGRPITGADYMALEYGPAPRHLLPIRAQMIEDDELIFEQRANRERIVPLGEADLSSLTAAEISIVGEVIEALTDASANEVSELSHHFLGWLAAMQEGKTNGKHTSIPYSTAWVGQIDPDNEPELVKLGQELASKHEWPV